MNPFEFNAVRLRRLAMLALPGLGMLLGMQDAMAVCVTRPEFSTINLYMTVGRVFIKPDDPVGTTYPGGTRGYDFPINAPELERPFECNGVGGTIYGNVNAPGVLLDPVEKWYSTNVPGIAIQLSRTRGGSIILYPHTLDTVNNFGPIVPGSKFTVRLKKTAPVTGSGPLSPGLYSTYTGYPPGSRSALSTYVVGDAITIVTPTCVVDAGSKLINVQLGKQPRNTFSGVGSTGPEKKFNIKLNCNSGTGTPLNQVYLRLDSTTAVAGKPGVLDLTPDPANAKGVAIQVRDGSTQLPVEFGGQGTYLGQTIDGSFNVPYSARYIQTGNTITAGKANGIATFTIDYK